MSMRFERDERKFDFHDIGREIKRKREASGMTQEQLAFIIDRDPRRGIERRTGPHRRA